MSGGWKLPRAMSTIIILVVLAVTGSIGPPEPTQASVQGLPSPGPGAMTVYAITNPGASAVTVENVLTNSSNFRYVFWVNLPANSTVTCHLRDIPQVPNSFQGTLTLYASSPFTAAIVGYDYPGSGPGPRVWLPFVAR